MKKKKAYKDNDHFKEQLEKYPLYRVIKCPITHIILNNEYKTKIITAVVDIDKLRKYAYNYFQMYFLKKYENMSADKEFKKYTKDDILQFFNSITSKDRSGEQGKNKDFERFVIEEKLETNIINRSNYSIILKDLAEEVITSYENNIIFRFFSRLYSYCKALLMNADNAYEKLKNMKKKQKYEYYKKLKSHANVLVNIILFDEDNYLKNSETKIKKCKKESEGIKLKEKSLLHIENMFTNYFNVSIEYNFFEDVAEIRKKVLPKITDKSVLTKDRPYNYYIKKAPFEYFKHMIYINFELRRLKYKQFVCFPKSSKVRTNYVNFSLSGICTYLKIKKEGKTYAEDPILYWRKILDHSKKIFKCRRINKREMYRVKSFRTDGFGVSVLFEKNYEIVLTEKNRRKKLPKEQKNEPRYLDDLSKNETYVGGEYNFIWRPWQKQSSIFNGRCK